MVDGATAYSLLPADVASATPVSGANGRELKLVLTSNNGLTNDSLRQFAGCWHFNSRYRCGQQCCRNSGHYICNNCYGPAAAAPSATAIGGVDFIAPAANTLTVVGAAGGGFDDTIARRFRHKHCLHG